MDPKKSPRGSIGFFENYFLWLVVPEIGVPGAFTVETTMHPSLTVVRFETTRVLKSMTDVLSETTRVIKSMTAVLQETNRVIKSITAVLSETTRVI